MGSPGDGESALFERLCLEGFQAGLSWQTILTKRPRFREVFAGFDVDTVAAMAERDVVRLLQDPGIIRHRGKIESTIRNARATIGLRADGGLVDFVAGFRPRTTPRPKRTEELLTASPESTICPRL